MPEQLHNISEPVAYLDFLWAETFADTTFLTGRSITTTAYEHIIVEFRNGRVMVYCRIIKCGETFRDFNSPGHGMQYRHWVQGTFILSR